jgi:hypothetical protein
VFAVALVAAVASLVGFTRESQAGVTYDLQLSGGGHTTTLSTAFAGTITANIFLYTDEAITAASVTVEWDTDNANELDLVSASHWFGTKIVMGVTFTPLNPTFTDSSEASQLVRHFVSTVTIGSDTGGPGTYKLGTIVWSPNIANVTNDGNDISAIIFGLVDGFTVLGSATNNQVDIATTGIAVNIVPEPGTAALVGLGLMGLVLAGRRNRA